MHRGGLGQTFEIEVLTDEPYLFSGLYERTQYPAPGLAGGHSGPPGRLLANKDVGLKPKISQLLPADTVVTLEIPGGGGFGPPLERDPEQVLDDVLDGYISIEAAKSKYGVVVLGETGSVDRAETETLRAELARQAVTAE